MADGTEAWLALIGATFGGAGLKFIEYWLSKDKTKVDEATQIRTELRAELTGLRVQVDNLEKQVTEWRDKYYEVVQELIDEKSKSQPAPRKRRKATPKDDDE